MSRDIFWPQAFRHVPEPLYEKDNLIGDSNTWNKAFRYYRAAGECVCPTCGLITYDHPVCSRAEKIHYGIELRVLCNTDRVKT